MTSTGDDRQRRMEAARVRAGLSVQELWLRFIALGGTGDAFDLDGYLQALSPLGSFEQDVLAQALNEALEDDYRAHCIPLSTPVPDELDTDRLRPFVEALLDAQLAAFRDRSGRRRSRPSEHRSDD